MQNKVNINTLEDLELGDFFFKKGALYAMKPIQTYSKIEPTYADITYVYLVKKL